MPNHFCITSERRDVLFFMLHHHQDQLIQAQHILERRRRRRLYDRLMVELHNEDTRAFKKFMRMPPAMYDEIMQRLTPAFLKQTTNWRAPLEPGLKVDCRSSGSANVKTSRRRPLCAALQTTSSGVYP